MSYDDYDQDAAEARFDDEMAQLERIAELESLVKDMARDCMGCKFECYSENSSGGGYCGIFERVRNLTDGDAE